MKYYEKVVNGPVGLKVTVITDNTFNDDDIHEQDKPKLKAAIRGGLIKEIEKPNEEVKVQEKAENNELAELLEKIKAENIALHARLEEFKGIAYLGLTADEMVKVYLKDELLDIAKTLKIEVTSKSKELTIAKAIEGR